MIKIISKTEAMDLIKQTNGKIFSAEFVKRTDGTYRKMDCRTGVKKGVKGVGQKFDPASKGLIGVFEMLHINHEPGNKHFRFINLETLFGLVVNKQTYVVNG